MVEEAIIQIDELNARGYLIRSARSFEAAESAEEALRLSEEIDYRKGIGCALRTLAAARVAQSLTNAYVNAVRSIEILLAENHLYEACSAYPVLYIYYHTTGQRKLAHVALQACIELATQSGNRYVEALGSYNLGWQLSAEGDHASAEIHLRRASQAAWEVRDYDVYGLAMAETATLYAIGKISTFDYDSILESIEALEADGTLPGLVEVLRAQVIYLSAIGDHVGAIRAYRRARYLAKKSDNMREYTRAMTSWAEAHVRRGNLTRAKRVYQQEIKVLDDYGFETGKAEVLLRLSRVEQDLGNFEAALHHLRAHGQLREQHSCASSEARHRELEVLYRTNELAKQAESAMLQAGALSEANDQLRSALERQADLQRELMRIASTDELTGAVNRRQIVNDGILEMERYRHTGSPFSVTIIDIDHFKSINDTFGHATGDEVLRRLTKCCQALLRKFDVFGRLGGEEFCIVHHDTDLHGATMAVERIMRAIETMFMADILPDRTFSVSIGVAQVHESDSSFYDVLHQADMALYEAKRNGRNTYRTTQSRSLESRTLEAA